MAQGYYEKLYKSLKAANKIPKTTEEKVGSQISNAKTRLSAAGVDVDKVTDTRNPVEKMLNLTEDQNFLFDMLELLGRPQQTIFGAVDAAQKGEDIGKGALDGLTGKDYTYGGQLLRNAGMKDSEGIGLDDVLGFGLDILADPVDLALIPVTGGSNLALDAARQGGKGLKVADNVADISKGAKLVRDGGAVKGVTGLMEQLDTLKDASTVATNSKKLKSVSDLVFSTAGKGIKGTAKISDNLLEKAFKTMDAKGVKNFDNELVKFVYDNPIAKNASQLGKKVDNLGEITGNIPKGRLETYKEVKNWFSRSFNNAANLPRKTMEALRKGNADSVRAAVDLKFIRTELDDNILNTARTVAKQLGDESAENVDKIAKKLDQSVLHLKEYLDSANRTGTMQDVLKMAKSGTLKYSDEVAAKIDNIAKDVNLADRGLKLGYEIDDVGNIKLSNDWKKLGTKAYEGVDLDNTLLNEVIKLPTNYTEKQIKQLEKLKKQFATDPILQDFYSKVDPIFDRANSIIDKNFGTGLATRYADNAGYVRHAYDRGTFDKLRKLGLINEDGTFKLKGNTKVLGDRKYKMSVMEANNMFKDTIMKNYDSLTKEAQQYVKKHNELFSTLYTSSFDNYLENIPKIAKDNKIIDEIFVKQTFGDWKELNKVKNNIKKADKLGDKALAEKLTKEYKTMLEDVNMKVLSNSDPVVPSGFRRLSTKETEQLAGKLTKIADELGIDSMRDMAKFVNKKGTKLAINDDILRLIEVNADDKTPGALLRVYDTTLNFFKRNKVLSPTFQMNNIIGNTSNMAMGGISPTRQAQLFPKAAGILSNADDLMQKAATGAKLTAKETEMLNIWNKFINEGFGDAKSIMDLRDMPPSLRAYFTGEKKFEKVKDFLVDGLPYINNKMNNYMDTASRLVAFMEASNNPKLLSSLNVKSAGDAVRKILFDPSDLTKFEKDVMKRIVPFYTFTKKNLAFHISNLGENGRKYHRFMKGYKGIVDGVTEGNYDSVADYLKNNLYVPLPAIGKDGQYTMIRASIPFGQLTDFAANPLQNAVSMLAPGVRAPIEYVGNMQAFNGLPIEKFEGEKSKNIPFMTKKQEYALSQLTGLDVPLKQATRLTQGLMEEGTLLDKVGAGIGNMTTTKGDVSTDKLYKMYEELDQLETIMKQFKQQGYEFSTMNELKKANDSKSTDKIMAQLNKLSGLKDNPYSLTK